MLSLHCEGTYVLGVCVVKNEYPKNLCIWQLTQPELAMNEQVILHGGWIQSARHKLLIHQTDRLAVAKALHKCEMLALWKDWLLLRFSIRPA